MYHVDNKTGVATMPDIPPSESTVPQWFTEGGPGEEPTVPGSTTWNIWQAELLNILAAAEVVPDKFKLNQIAESIGIMIANAIENAELLPGISYKPRTDSLNNQQGAIPNIKNKDLNTCVAGEFGLYEKATCTNSPPSAGSYFYCETKSIYSTGALIQIAWSYDGAGVLAWRNFSQNTHEWDAVWREGYDTGHKPSSADVGAANESCNFAAKLGHSRAVAGATLPDEAGVWSVESSTWAPEGYGTCFVTTNLTINGTPTGQGTFIHYIFLGHTSRQLWTAVNVNGSWSGWKKHSIDGHTHDWSQVTGKPSTMPPSSHTHTAAQGNADVVASGWGQVGSYCLATCIVSTGGNKGPGYTIAGSSLRAANTEDGTPGIGSALSGTWKLLGAIKDGGNNDQNTSLWIRIS